MKKGVLVIGAVIISLLILMALIEISSTYNTTPQTGSGTCDINYKIKE